MGNLARPTIALKRLDAIPDALLDGGIFKNAA
jgi:hypothetical protein